MEVAECSSSERVQGTVRLHHVSFRGNTLSGSIGLQMRSPSCSTLELVDFEFENNTCSDRCGVILSTWNRLRDIRVRRVRLSGSTNDRPAVFYAHTGSQTSVERMDAAENEWPLLYIRTGKLEVSNATFTRNTVQRSSGLSFGSCVHLENATATLEDCRFRNNTAEDGAAVAGSRSNVTLTNSHFEKNEAQRGGAVNIRDASSITIRSCTFTSNEARENAGVLSASGSQVHIQQSDFAENTARFSSGCPHLNELSTLELRDSTFDRNRGTYAGAIGMDESTGNLTSCFFKKNAASVDGGSLFVRNGRLSLQNCHLFNGSAEDGGGVFVTASRVSIQGSRFSHNTAGEYGGAVACTDQCRLEDVNSTYLDNTSRYGGALYLEPNSTANLEDCRLSKNTAFRSGGVAYVQNSTLSASNCQFSKGNATHGGFIFVSSGEVNVLNVTFKQAWATYGGCIQSGKDSRVIIRDAQITSCRSNSTGGAVDLEESAYGIIRNVRFSNNSARDEGGSLRVSGTNVSVSQCDFVDGNATLGGFIHSCCSSRLYLNDVVMKNSTAIFGGGLFARSGTVVARNISVENGTASLYGGGLCLYNTTTQLNTIEILSSISEKGGAIHMTNSNVTGHQWTLKNNFAADYGGGVNIDDSNFTGREMLLDGNNAVHEAGGVYISESSALLEDSMIRNSIAEYGAAVSILVNSTGIFVDVTFEDTSASYSGGSVYVEESNTTFDGCVFQRGSAGGGGGFLHLRTAVYANIRNSVMTNGSAEWGGCLNADSTILTIQNVTMQGCRASSSGGAIITTLETTAVIANSSFLSNRAEYGGGMYTDKSITHGVELIWRGNVANESGGGIYIDTSPSANISNSIFESNSARNGGAVLQFEDLSTGFVNVTFRKNQASMRGGSFYSTKSVTQVRQCMFVDGIAQNGGLFYSRKDIRMEVINTAFINGTARIGGCLKGDRGNLTIWNATVRGCSASKTGGAVAFVESAVGEIMDSEIAGNHAREDGGAIHVSNSTVFGRGMILENNTADDNGGAISSTDDGIVNIVDSQIRNSEALSGGAIDLVSSNGAMTNVTFTDNSATLNGGDCRLRNSVMDFKGGRLSRSAAEEGASFFVSASTLNVMDSKFKKGRAVVQGGFVSAQRKSSIVMKRSSMVDGRSVRGGAIVLFQSDLKAQAVEIVQCSAEGDGGGVLSGNSSRVLCIGCMLDGNTATRGGGLFVKYSDPHTLALQLVGSTVHNNEAEFGGKIQRIPSIF